MMIGSLLLVLLTTLASISAFGLLNVTPKRRGSDQATVWQYRKAGGGKPENTAMQLFPGSRFESFVDKVFDRADTNKDGTIDLAETYEMVLQIYVKLNRQAPIPPPPRHKVYELFQASDIDKNNRISRDEFSKLARTLGRRAITRLLAHKLVTLIGAPILAEFTLRQFMGRAWLHKLAARVIPEPFLSTVTSVSFCRTILIILFVASLGNIVLGVVNFVLDFQIGTSTSAAKTEAPITKKES